MTQRPAPRIVATVRRWYERARRLGPAVPLAVVSTALPFLGGAALYGRVAPVVTWLRSGGIALPVTCAAVFAVAAGVAVLPTYAISVVCGWAFGFCIGLSATLASFVGAALVGYAITAAADGGRVMRVVRETTKWSCVHHALSSGSPARLTAVVALIRLAPFTPFSLTSTALAALRVPLLPYTAGTLLGMTPRAVVVTYFASRMTTAADARAGGPWFLPAALAATLAVVWALAWLGRRGLARMTAGA